MSDDVVLASGYFPVGLWLGPSTCLVYTDESPDPNAVADLVAGLSDQGLREIEVADDLRAAVLAVTMARVQDIGGLVGGRADCPRRHHSRRHQRVVIS
jgi:hypothetical protein